jgi:hypothetical protein
MLQGKLNQPEKGKYLHIREFYLQFSVLQCTRYQPISVAGLDLSVNYLEILYRIVHKICVFKCRFLERVAAGARQPPTTPSLPSPPPPGVSIDISVTRFKKIPEMSDPQISIVNPLTPNDLERRRAVSPLKIKIPIKNIRENPTNTPTIHSVY